MYIQVFEKEWLQDAGEFAGVVELGRRKVDEPDTFAWQPRPGRWRVLIARLNEDTVSRQHAELTPLSAERVRLTNLSKTQSILLADGARLATGARTELQLPATLTVGDKTIKVLSRPSSAALEDEPDVDMHSLSGETLAPGRFLELSAWPLAAVKQPGQEIEIEPLVRWLQTVMGVLHSAATSADFFDKAAQALVDRVGLETGWVVLWQDGKWQVSTVRSAPGKSRTDDQPSQRLLDRVRDEKRTFWMEPSAATLQKMSLAGVQTVVAAPILDHSGAVIGALYGDRRQGGSTTGSLALISRVEAMLVELLASSVATGLARLTQEQAALAARIQFGQFFSPELSEQLAINPDLLEGKDAEVSVLFCDLRGFSRISERLGPARTMDWLQNVLSELSGCVRRMQGVLVDYIGDELMAMWGAPKDQPDHPWLSCQAALQMLETVPELNRRWQAQIGEPIGMGIGINTGVARVGNTGSRYKFKYGPLGNTVNVGSRVQGATKYLHRPLLVTGATWNRIPGRCADRRLARVRVINIKEPIDLYELVHPEPAGWPDLKRGYEEALAAFEQHDLLGSAQRLGRLLAEYPEDGPIRALLMRTMQALLGPPQEFDPVWELPGK